MSRPLFRYARKCATQTWPLPVIFKHRAHETWRRAEASYRIPAQFQHDRQEHKLSGQRHDAPRWQWEFMWRRRLRDARPWPTIALTPDHKIYMGTYRIVEHHKSIMVCETFENKHFHFSFVLYELLMWEPTGRVAADPSVAPPSCGHDTFI